MRAALAVNQKGAGDESPDALREVRDGRDVRASHANHITSAAADQKARRVTYPAVTAHGHHRADRKGMVHVHILVAEAALGRPLDPRHEVHHVDGDKRNNAPGNLVICEGPAYHKLLHQRTDALAACGDANARLCHYCHTYDRQDDILFESKGSRGYKRPYHRSCRIKFFREYHASRRSRASVEAVS